MKKTIEDYIADDVKAGGSVLVLRVYLSTPDPSGAGWDEKDLMFGASVHKDIADDLIIVSTRPTFSPSAIWSEGVQMSRLEAIGQHVEVAALIGRDDFRATVYNAGEEEVRIEMIGSPSDYLEEEEPPPPESDLEHWEEEAEIDDPATLEAERQVNTWAREDEAREKEAIEPLLSLDWKLEEDGDRVAPFIGRPCSDCGKPIEFGRSIYVHHGPALKMPMHKRCYDQRMDIIEGARAYPPDHVPQPLRNRIEPLEGEPLSRAAFVWTIKRLTYDSRIPFIEMVLGLKESEARALYADMLDGRYTAEPAEPKE